MRKIQVRKYKSKNIHREIQVEKTKRGTQFGKIHIGKYTLENTIRKIQHGKCN